MSMACGSSCSGRLSLLLLHQHLQFYEISGLYARSSPDLEAWLYQWPSLIELGLCRKGETYVFLSNRYDQPNVRNVWVLKIVVLTPKSMIKSVIPDKRKTKAFTQVLSGRTLTLAVAIPCHGFGFPGRSS